MSLLTSLVSYWQLEEAAGATRADSFGTNNLTDNNTVGQAVGIIGNAASFSSGSSQFLSVNNNATLQLGGTDFTIQAWVYLTNKSAIKTFLAKWNLDISSVEYICYYDNGTDNLTFGTSPNGSSGDVLLAASNFGSVPLNTWLHFFATYDSVGGQMAVSINNGTANTAAQGAVYTGTSTLNLGRQQTSGGLQYWDGRIDEVAIWKRVLTSAEHSQLWNGGQGLSFSLFPGQFPLMPETGQGPPLRGSPWAQRLFVIPADFTSLAQAPIPPPPGATPSYPVIETGQGPPLRGAPWAQRLLVQSFPPPPAPAPPAPAATPNLYAPEVVIGPPLRGSPFAQRLVIENHPLVTPPFTPGVPTVLPKVAGKPFLERVPDIRGPSAQERLRRHTEMLANVINSLSATGQLVQTGSTQWKIMAAGIATLGLSGTFNSGTFGGGGGSPGSGKSGTFNSGSF